MVKGIGSEIITLPVAEVPIKYQGWQGRWKAGIADRLPAPCLIGIDLSEHVKSVLVQKRSQKENKETAEENLKFLQK